MSCEKVETSLLQDYLEKTIDPLEKIFIESHLNTCKQCRRELSELKLMFWELDNKGNYETEYPKELDTMGTDLIDTFLGKKLKSSTRKVVDMQVNTLKISQKFLKYMPGAKQTPKILKKASKGLAKGVRKILIAK